MYYEVTTATPGAELFAEYMGPIGIDTQVKQVDGRLWWASDSEARFSNWWNPTMNFIFGPMKFNVAGRAWNNWYNSNGESGEEPPPAAKRLYEGRAPVPAGSRPTAMSTRKAARFEQESYYIASQWRLMWRKFKSHRLAMVGTAIVAFFIITGTLFCEFFATHGIYERDSDYILCPPQKITWVRLF